MKDMAISAGPVEYVSDEKMQDEPGIGDNLRLKGYVIYQQLREVLDLPEGFHRWKGRFQFKKIGNALFAKTDSISDPVIRAAAKCCKQLDNYVPLAELMIEVGAYSDARKKAVKEELAAKGLIYSLYNTYLVEIGIEAARMLNHPEITTFFMELSDIDALEPDLEEGFDQVIEISNQIRLGGWK